MDFNTMNLTIENISAFNNDIAEGIRIEWFADIGFGVCDIYRQKDDELKRWRVDTEHLSNNNDKRFLKTLLNKISDMLLVEG